MTPEMWQVVAVLLGPAGAAWAGVKMGLNGARADIKEIKGDVKEIRGDVSKHAERLAVIESKEGS
jgi:hypothetical protein